MKICCDKEYEERIEGKDIAGSAESGLSGAHVVGMAEKPVRQNANRITHGDGTSVVDPQDRNYY